MKSKPPSQSNGKPRLTLVQGSLEEASMPGPVTRMGLWNRFEPTSPRLWAFVIFTKCALLATLGYLYFG